MKRHTFLRTATLAVPGTLLTGWAPARGAVRQIQLVVRDATGDRAPGTLSQGVDLGLEEVAWNAKLLHLPMTVTRVSAEAEGANVDDPAAIQIVVATEDDHRTAEDDAWGTRIYTCPLLSWRPDAWSVASPLAAHVGDIRLDWHPELATPGAAALNARFRRRTGVPMDAAAWHGWMAVKVAFEVSLRSEDDLLALQFDGHKGSPLHFSEDGHLVQPTVRVRAGRPELVEAVDADLLCEFN